MTWLWYLHDVGMPDDVEKIGRTFFFCTRAANKPAEKSSTAFCGGGRRRPILINNAAGNLDWRHGRHGGESGGGGAAAKGSRKK